ncbi:MAG TPA: diaminopimelate decarboxylase [Candidatus Binatia bacterium]|jgi:diaminopimelate decarboxylase|nr:diaminopimelate decarboxylase [Candidatus Binatia bacterium]
MHHFQYRQGELYAEDVPVARIAEQVGTPVYLYSLATLRRHYQVFDEAFVRIKHLVCFSIKANSNLAVLRTFAQEGSGFDVVSSGELFRALKAGGDPRKVVFSGVGKSREEITYALAQNILMFNVESEQELDAIDAVAGSMGKKAPVSLRVNPDVDPQTHPYISTGMKKSKFGVDIKRSLDEYERARALPNLNVIGVDCHIGSQLTSTSPFVDALARVKELILRLRERGFVISHLDLGGGLGITYNDEKPPEPKEYAGSLMEMLGALATPNTAVSSPGTDLTLVLEPGRVIVGNAGILVTRVLYRKSNGEKNFVVVDGGMNDLIRPALYGSYQGIQPVKQTTDQKIVADVVGPVCESGDFFAKDREVTAFAPGELMAVMSAGAYGFVMASNYNTRPRPAEVLVDGTDFFVVRERETLEDLIRGERVPAGLR